MIIVANFSSFSVSSEFYCIFADRFGFAVCGYMVCGYMVSPKL